MIGRLSGLAGVCGVVLFGHALTVFAATAGDNARLTSAITAENRVTVLQRGPRFVTFISADRTRPIPVRSIATRPETRAHTFLRDQRGLLLGSSAPLELRTTQTYEMDVAGISHVRVQQQFAGISIRGAEAIVHLTDAGVTAVSSRLIALNADFNTTPQINSPDALQTAQQVVVQQYGPVAANFSVPVLEIIDAANFGIDSSTPVLAWYFEATSNALRERIWINAWTGDVAWHFSQLTDARNRLTYNAANLTAVPTTPVRVEGQAATGDLNVDNAHDYAGDFYDYFLNVHGRDSYDNKGANILSVARMCRPAQKCPMDNAYWDGIRIYLGQGYGVDDVVAHELSHAVIEKTSNLDYLNMSGALNESYADIFGEAVDLGNGRGTDTPGVRWMLGEDLASYRGIGLRNLMDPALRGQPPRVTDTRYQCNPDVDNGGVHNNSGVPNHAYALMADGGTYNGYAISGIGITKASAIQYRALAFYLTTSSQFIDNVDALIQSCTDLIGTNSMTHDDCSQVKKALLAVEMTTVPCPRGAVPPAPPPPAPSPKPVATGQCPSGEVVLPVFSDDFEDPLSGNWITGAIVGANHWLGGSGVPAIYATEKAASGTLSLHGTAAGSAGDSFVELNTDINLPPQAQLYFDGLYDFDGGFDGGVLEFSVDAGGTWRDAGALILLGRNYDGGLANGMDNPLGGRTAFTGHTASYTGTRVDLSSLAGVKARFRFRFATDRSVPSPGWWIDNFSVYSCLQLSPGVDITPLNGLVTTEAGGTATFSVVLKSPPTASVTLGFTSSDVAEGAVSPVALVFSSANWSTPQSIIITGVDDAVDDGDVLYQVVTANAVSVDPGFGGMSVPDVLVTNIDNDGAAIVATPTSGLVTSESGGVASFTLKLQTQPIANVTLTLSIDQPGEAMLLASVVEFTPTNWNSPRTIYLSGVDDSIVDAATPFAVSMTIASKDPKYLALIAPVIIGFNADDDFAGVIIRPDAELVTSELGSRANFSIRLTSSPRSSVIIALSSDNTNEGTVLPASVVFDATNWKIPQSVTVVGVDDTVADGNVPYHIVTAPAVSTDTAYSGFNAANVTVTNIDNETANILIDAPNPLITSESGIRGNFTVVLTSKPTANVAFRLSSNLPTEGQLGITSVSFDTGNWNIPQTVIVTGIDDPITDGDVTYAIITSAAVSADPAYSGMNPLDVVSINVDDDIPDFVFQWPNVLQTTEKGGKTQFAVALLIKPVANVSLRLSSSNSSEGVVSPAALNFTVLNWNVPQTITVTGVNDALLDGAVNYDVILDASFSIDANYRKLIPRHILISNLDDENSSQPQGGDLPSIIVTPRFNLVTSEDGDVATFTVKLSRAPSGMVKIPLRSSNTAEGRVQPATLEFDASNWNMPQTVTVVGRDDSVVDGNAVYKVFIDSPTSDDLAYASVGTSEVLLTNRDNDRSETKAAGGALGPWLLVLLGCISIIRRYPRAIV